MFFTIDDIVTSKKYNVNVIWITSLKNGDDTKTAPNFELLIYQGDGGRPLVESFSSAAERRERREAILEAGSFFILGDIHYNIVWVQSIGKVKAGDTLYDGNLAQKSGVYVTFANGRTLYGMFDTEVERDEFYEILQELMIGGGLVQEDSQSDFPNRGNKHKVYLARDTGQTYYWDEVSKTYITTGTAGRTGVYSTTLNLPETIGASKTIKKSDLTEILKPSVPYSEGSEVIGDNSVHGIIVSSTATTVEVKTITDLTIDSFKQVEKVSDLPTAGVTNVLYYVQEDDEFRIWDVKKNAWEEPFHPIVYGDVPAADARLYTIYVVDNKMRYTIDNTTWIEVDKHVDEYNQNTKYYKDMFVYNGEYTARVVADYTSDSTEPNVTTSFEKDIADGNLVLVSGKSKLEKDIKSNVDCGAAAKGTLFKEGMTFQEFAETILRKDISPTIKVTSSANSLNLCGSTINNLQMNLDITNLSDVTYSVNKINFYLDGTLVDTQAFVSGQRTYRYTHSNPITSNVPVTYEVKVELEYGTLKTVNGTVKFEFVDPSYVCATTYPSISDAEANTLAMSTSKITKKVKGYTWNNITLNDERFCYMYPKSFGALTSIKDGNGFEQITSYTRSEVTITDIATGVSVDYYAYLLTDSTTGTGFKQIYS